MLEAVVGAAVAVAIGVGGWHEWRWQRSPLGQANLAAAAYRRRRRTRQRWHALEWSIIGCAALSLLGWCSTVVGVVR